MARILILSSFYPPHHFGGYELSCHDVVARWRARGHEVRILTSEHRWPDVATPADEPVDRTLRLYLDGFEQWSPHPLVRLRTERHNQQALKRVLRSFEPDIVSVWMMGWMSFGLLTTVVERGLPMVCVLQDDWLDFGPRYDAWARLFVDRPRAARAVRALTGVPTSIADIGQAGTFCFVSEDTRRFAEERSRWTFPSATTVWSGVDSAAFYPMPRRDDWRWQLLYVGRVRRTKGVDTAVSAMALLPEAHLTLIGKGDPDYEAEVRALADELGVSDRITWATATREELRTHYAEADALIFPSRWREPLGLVPLEAMACGTPVVATGRGGSGEFCIDEVTCLRFDANDAEGLAACVRRLAGDPELRARIVRAGFATAAELNVDRLAEVLEQWHLAAVEGFAHGTPADRQLSLAGS